MVIHATWMLEPGPIMTGCDRSFPPRCKSESCPIIISATQLMPCQNSNVISQYWTCSGAKMAAMVSGVLEPGQAMTCHNVSFPHRYKSEWYPIIISATHLMHCPNSSVISQYKVYSWAKYHSFGTAARTGHDRSWVFHLGVHVKAIPESLVLPS